MQKILKKKLNKIGILGGTFDPPHIGHLHISKQSLKKLKLQKIIWIITKQNPLKKRSYLDKNLRIKLAKDLVKNERKIFVKYLDNIVKSKNTFNLLSYLKKKNKKNKIFFIMGADNLINFHKWHKSNSILQKCNILVFDRHGYKKNSLKSKTFKQLSKTNLEFIEFNKVNISSSQLRKI